MLLDSESSRVSCVLLVTCCLTCVFSSSAFSSCMLTLLCVIWTGLRELPYWSSYSKPRLVVHVIISSKYFDLCISGIIGLNVITMALEFHMMPPVSRTPFRFFFINAPFTRCLSCVKLAAGRGSVFQLLESDQNCDVRK